MEKGLEELFRVSKPIIGMIHLKGDMPNEIIDRALREVKLFAWEGINGALVEDYFCEDLDVMHTILARINENGPKNFQVGVNVLQDPLYSFEMAGEYNLGFVQLDYVSGRYMGRRSLDVEAYNNARSEHSNVTVLGGVWPKYCIEVEGSDLSRDLEDAMGRAEAIVVTGEGTGEETPLERIGQFRKLIGDFPLVVGAGLTPYNAYEQLSIADGAIVGSSLKKEGKAPNEVDFSNIRKLMDVVRNVRNVRRK